MDLQDRSWYSKGFDCPDGKCEDALGELIARPFEKVGEWMNSAPYRLHKWQPMDMQSVLGIMNAQDDHSAAAVCT